MTESAQTSMNFHSIGGSWQLSVNTATDFYNVLKLDSAHWAMTAIRAENIRCDRDFLNLMLQNDSDRIRVGSVRSLLAWMLDTFIDLQGALDGSDTVSVSSLNDKSADGPIIIETIREILAKLGKTGEDTLSIPQICEYKQTILTTELNGDSIIPPEAVSDADTEKFIRLVMSVSGCEKDASGLDGIGVRELNSYLKIAADYLDWRNRGIKDKNSICTFGDETSALYSLYQKVKNDIDQFFDSCRALVYTETQQAQDIRNKFDPMDQASYEKFFDKAPIAPANHEFKLNLSSQINPAKSDAFQAFLRAYRRVVPGTSKELSLSEWDNFKKQIAPYEAWISSKNTNLFDTVSTEIIQKSLSGKYEQYFRGLFEQDQVVAGHIAHCDIVCKLLLCQKHMRIFLNNFVSMQALFSRKKTSLLIAGKLVMDGRHFDLAMQVADVPSHKVIAEKSNICIMYLSVAEGIGAAQKKMTIAVAVTSGTMSSLFIGKTGLFYTDDGKVRDAVVIDFIKQPVSIREVLMLPFAKLADILKKQTDKYLSSRSKSFEDQTAAATTSPDTMKSATTNGSMLLMGGSIGIAAIGSSFAFMAKTLKDVSFSTIISVIIGIIFIFGAPFVISGLLKLRNRSLTLFLEANGCSMNRKIRMSLLLGHYFTYVPKLPTGSKFYGIFNPFQNGNVPDEEHNIIRRIALFGILILIVFCLTLAYFFNRVSCCKKVQSNSLQEQMQPFEQPGPTSETAQQQQEKSEGIKEK